MVLAAKVRFGVATALLGPLGMFTFGPVPAYASTSAPTVTITGQLIQFADQTGPAVAAVRTADNQLVPVNAAAVAHLRSGSTVTVRVAVPAPVRTAAAGNRTLTARGPGGKLTSTPVTAADLAAASSGVGAPATSNLAKATTASAASTGAPLEVSAVLAATAPAASASPAPRHLFVAVVTPRGWPTANTVTTAQIQAQVAGASGYWSAVSGGAISLDITRFSAPYTSEFSCSDDVISMFAEAATKTGFTYQPNSSVVIELPTRIDTSPASGCRYGSGTIGADVNGNGALYVADTAFPALAHELGHNMSLQHANTLECPAMADTEYTTSWAGPYCREVPYGDGTDVMASSLPSYAPFLSAPQSLRTGIIPASAATVLTANATTVLTLNALGSRTGVRAAQVVDPVGNVTYYVEYRTGAPPDTANVYGETLGVRVLRLNPKTGATVVLDATPGTSPATDRDATLHPSGTFTSYSGAVRVSTLSTTTTTATVSVTIDVTATSTVQRYVTRVYSDLFNRVPDAGGLASWTAALNSGTPRVAVANSITYSTEYRSKLISGSYDHYLGRAPDPGGLASWLGAMSRGWTISQMESGFIASDEYYAKAGSTDAGWVAKLYTDVLARPAGPSEVAYWTGGLRSMRRDQVAMGFLLSTERLSTVVDGYYQDLLGRGLDPSGQQYWVGILQAGGRNEAIIGGIIASAEYYGRV